jgi:hypothetical protein
VPVEIFPDGISKFMDIKSTDSGGQSGKAFGKLPSF